MPKRKAMTASSVFVAELVRLAQAARNPERAKGQAKYLRNQFVCLGLARPEQRDLLKPLLASTPFTSEASVLEAASALWELPEREYQYFAMDLCVKHHKLMTPAAFPLFTTMVTTKSWWDTVDCVASSCIGDLTLRHPSIHGHMDEWARDPSCMWKRRTALIYQLKFHQHTDLTRLQRNILGVIKEDEFFIQKAIGWALRQVSKHDKAWVKGFVEGNKDSMSTLAKREASKYL